LSSAIEFILAHESEDEQEPPADPELPALIDVDDPVVLPQRRGAIDEDSAYKDVSLANSKYQDMTYENDLNKAISLSQQQARSDSDIVSISLDEDLDVRDLSVPMGLNAALSGLGSVVNCVIQIWFSIPIIRRIVISLPTSQREYQCGYAARELQKTFAKLQFGTKTSTSANDVVESLLPSSIYTGSSSKQVQELFYKCLAKVSRAIMDILTYFQRTISDAESRKRFEELLQINDVSLLSLFTIEVKSHLSFDDNTEEELQQRHVFDLTFDKSIIQTLDELFWPSSDLYFTIENRPRVITFLLEEGKKCEAVPIQKEIFLDRYFACNIEQIMKTRQAIENLREEKEKILKKMAQSNFHDLPIHQILQYTAKYIQQEEISSGKDHTECINRLTEFNVEQQQQHEIYQNLLKQYENDMACIWDSMKQQKYELHAVIVQTMSMNYQVYIYNHSSSQWTKFYNHTVFTVDEADVEDLFIPGKVSERPYLLFYLDASHADYFNHETSTEDLFRLLPEYIQQKLKRKEQAKLERKRREQQQKEANKGEDYHHQMNQVNQPITITSNNHFTVTLEKGLNSTINSYNSENNHPPSLHSFEYFLLSLNKREVLQYHLAEELHKRAYKISLHQDPTLSTLLRHADIIPSNINLEDIEQYKELYAICNQVLGFFVSGILAFTNENFEESLEWLLMALQKDSEEINFASASRKGEIVSAIRRTCLRLVEEAVFEIEKKNDVNGIGKGEVAMSTAVTLQTQFGASSVFEELKLFWEKYNQTAFHLPSPLDNFLMDVRFGNFHPTYIPYQRVTVTGNLWDIYLEAV